MSQQHRRHGLFLPSEASLGGAMELNATYSNFMRKTYEAQPRVVSMSHSSQPTAQQLSLQRARKLAETDATYRNHLVNLHHLQRRIAEASSSAGHPRDSRPHSPPLQRTQRPSSAALLCPWLPASILAGASSSCSMRGGASRRPATAPGQLTGSSTNSGSNSGSGSEWRQLKQKHHPVLQPPVWPVQLPDSRLYVAGPNLLPSVQHRLYKSAIMSDILERQLYRAADIRSLCADYVRVNPLEHRELLRQVVAEVKLELEIGP